MKLTDKIHILKHNFEIHLGPGKSLPRFVNSLIIFGDEIILIDSGVKTSIENIFRYIEQNMRDPSEVSTLILSHSHPDHMGSASKLKQITGCRVLAHEAEKDWIEDIERQHRQRPVPGFLRLVDEPVKLDGFLKHYQLWQVDKDLTLKIIHSPGHSRGSINIQFIEDKILFTADSIPLMKDIPNYEDYKDLLKSLMLIQYDQKFETLLSSWTSPISDTNKIVSLLEDAERYLEQLDSSVQKNYTRQETVPMEFCKKVIMDLELPEFYVNPIVDKAFRTHLL